MYRLKFKWTVSRGRDTYGYNICSLWVDGNKVSSCNGGGYDMKGTALAQWAQETFPEKVKKLNAETYYGLHFFNKKKRTYHPKFRKGYSMWLDGACGFDCIKRILGAIGFSFTFIDEGRNHSIYLMGESK